MQSQNQEPIILDSKQWENHKKNGTRGTHNIGKTNKHGTQVAQNIWKKNTDNKEPNTLETNNKSSTEGAQNIGKTNEMAHKESKPLEEQM